MSLHGLGVYPKSCRWFTCTFVHFVVLETRSLPDKTLPQIAAISNFVAYAWKSNVRVYTIYVMCWWSNSDISYTPLCLYRVSKVYLQCTYWSKCGDSIYTHPWLLPPVFTKCTVTRANQRFQQQTVSSVPTPFIHGPDAWPFYRIRSSHSSPPSIIDVEQIRLGLTRASFSQSILLYL